MISYGTGSLHDIGIDAAPAGAGSVVFGLDGHHIAIGTDNVVGTVGDGDDGHGLLHGFLQLHGQTILLFCGDSVSGLDIEGVSLSVFVGCIAVGAAGEIILSAVGGSVVGSSGSSAVEGQLVSVGVLGPGSAEGSDDVAGLDINVDLELILAEQLGPGRLQVLGQLGVEKEYLKWRLCNRC